MFVCQCPHQSWFLSEPQVSLPPILPSLIHKPAYVTTVSEPWHGSLENLRMQCNCCYLLTCLIVPCFSGCQFSLGSMASSTVPGPECGALVCFCWLRLTPPLMGCYAQVCSYILPLAKYQCFSPAVPSLFGTRDGFHGKQFFHRLGVRGKVSGWFKLSTFTVHFISNLMLLLTRQEVPVCSLEVGTPALINIYHLL